MRAAIYARYSSDLQSAASIEDQIRLCRERVERDGGTVVETYTDFAISGSSLRARAGMQALLADARDGRVSSRPIVELTLPSVVDPTLAPEGRHVASVFAQYAPARGMDDPRWPELRDQMRDRVLAVIDENAPGFSSSIEELEVLAAPDLERIFGLSGGNIFHGAMTPDRLLFMRPVPSWSRYRTPVSRLYLCGSGTHPGGGVMGAPGRNAALEILRDLRQMRRA